MNEKGLQYFPVVENFWEKREKFVKLNPMSTVPFIMAKPDILISGSSPICEYLEDVDETGISLINGSAQERAEVRRMLMWFDEKFFREVSEFILYERVFNFFKARTEPNQALIKIARTNLVYHMRYLQFLLSKRSWIAGDEFSLADIAAACQISSLDYLGEINWNNYPVAKDWYAVMKSRPSFRELLQDSISGFKPVAHYRELDF